MTLSMLLLKTCAYRVIYHSDREVEILKPDMFNGYRFECPVIKVSFHSIFKGAQIIYIIY